MNSTKEISTSNTVLPRHIAAILDNLLAMLMGLLAAKSISNALPAVQIAAAIVVYFAYYFLFEAAISRTPGKLLTGLIIVRKDGSRASIREAAIRTAFRVLEVNPALFGGLPAALSIIASVDHQRFGDKVAGTIVVPPRRIRRSF